jgi:hypothetical protein
MKASNILLTIILGYGLSSMAVGEEYQPLSHETVVYRPGTNKKADSHGVRQYRIPHITKGPDGELIVSVAGRTNVAGDNGHTTSAFAVSEDGGKTWEYIRFEADYSKPTPKGHFPMATRTNEIQVEWIPSIKEYFAIYADKGKCYQIRSKDLKTWGKPVLLPHQDKLKNSWPSPTSMHLEEDGTICFSIIGNRLESKGRSIITFWTKDGVEFEVSPLTPFEAKETSVAHVGDGIYLHVSRVKTKKQNRHVFTYNRKTGKWTDPVKLTVPTHHSCEQDILAHEGKVYLSAPRGPGRSNGCIYVSDDKGASWKVHHEMKSGDYFGYSSMVALDGGGIGLLSERKTDPDKLLNIVFTPVQ